MGLKSKIKNYFQKTRGFLLLKAGNEKNKFGFWLFIGTTCIISLVFIINLLRSYIETDWLSWIFYIPSALGHASLFALGLYLVFYFPFSCIFKNHKIPAIIFIVMAIVLQIVLILDGLVFNLYRFHINGLVLEMVFHGGNEIFVFDITLYFKFGLLIFCTAIIPYLLLFWIAKKRSFLLKIKTSLIICGALIFSILFSHLTHGVAAAVRQTSIQRSGTLLPYFFPMTMNQFLENWGIIHPDEIDQMYQDVSVDDVAYPINPITVDDSIPNYNILLIAIDSWNPRAFDSITMPFVHNLTSQYQYFTNHYSGNSNTNGSLFGIFYGLTYTYQSEFLSTKTSPVLIDMLLKHDYAIQVFPSGPICGNPFEVIFKKTPHVNLRTKGESPIERDKIVTQQTINHINEWKNKKPFFTFVFYDLPHAISLPKEYLKFQPTWTEANYMALNNNIDPVPFFNLYRSCCFQVDQQIKILLEYVHNNGLLENTVVIVTGDHGQEFNENKKNFWGHYGNFSKWQIQIPLLMHYPNMKENEHFSHTTTHYDIVPTLMKRYLGVTNPTTDYSMGYDLRDTISRYPHIVGNREYYGFIFKDIIVSTRPLGDMMITDKELNNLPRSAINIEELKKALDKKNMFYKKR